LTSLLFPQNQGKVLLVELQNCIFFEDSFEISNVASFLVVDHLEGCPLRAIILDRHTMLLP
jgi:hypothetical protein